MPMGAISRVDVVGATVSGIVPKVAAVRDAVVSNSVLVPSISVENPSTIINVIEQEPRRFIYIKIKGHNCGPHILVQSNHFIIKKCCCRVWNVALYLKSLD